MFKPRHINKGTSNCVKWHKIHGLPNAYKDIIKKISRDWLRYWLGIQYFEQKTLAKYNTNRPQQVLSGYKEPFIEKANMRMTIYREIRDVNTGGEFSRKNSVVCHYTQLKREKFFFLCSRRSKPWWIHTTFRLPVHKLFLKFICFVYKTHIYCLQIFKYINIFLHLIKFT